MCNHVKKKLNDLTFSIKLMAPMFLSDPIQDDDVHYILYKI